MCVRDPQSRIVSGTRRSARRSKAATKARTARENTATGTTRGATEFGGLDYGCSEKVGARGKTGANEREK